MPKILSSNKHKKIRHNLAPSKFRKKDRVEIRSKNKWHHVKIGKSKTDQRIRPGEQFKYSRKILTSRSNSDLCGEWKQPFKCTEAPHTGPFPIRIIQNYGKKNQNITNYSYQYKDPFLPFISIDNEQSQQEEEEEEEEDVFFDSDESLEHINNHNINNNNSNNFRKDRRQHKSIRKIRDDGLILYPTNKDTVGLDALKDMRKLFEKHKDTLDGKKGIRILNMFKSIGKIDSFKYNQMQQYKMTLENPPKRRHKHENSSKNISMNKSENSCEMNNTTQTNINHCEVCRLVYFSDGRYKMDVNKHFNAKRLSGCPKHLSYHKNKCRYPTRHNPNIPCGLEFANGERLARHHDHEHSLHRRRAKLLPESLECVKCQSRTRPAKKTALGYYAIKCVKCGSERRGSIAEQKIVKSWFYTADELDDKYPLIVDEISDELNNMNIDENGNDKEEKEELVKCPLCGQQIDKEAFRQHVASC